MLGQGDGVSEGCSAPRMHLPCMYHGSIWLTSGIRQIFAFLLIFSSLKWPDGTIPRAA
jgi:hypothetical protein